MDNQHITDIFNRIEEIQGKWMSIQKKYFKSGGKTQNFSEILNKEINKQEKPKIKTEVSDKENLDKKIEDIAKKHKVDPNIIRAVIEVESAWKPDAVSNKGAKGLMQLMDITSQEVGVKDPFDPYQNIEGGTKYLSGLLNKYDGSLEEALSAYNYGPSRVIKGRGVPQVTAVKNYVNSVLTKMNLNS